MLLVQIVPFKFFFDLQKSSLICGKFFSGMYIRLSIVKSSIYFLYEAGIILSSKHNNNLSFVIQFSESVQWNEPFGTKIRLPSCKK